MGIWNLRAKVAILWLVLTLLVVGVVAWAISAEVVMGAMRDAARKNSDISTMRLHQSFDDNSDDFSINRINKNIGESSRKSGIRSSETALMREVVHKEVENNKILNERQKSLRKQYSYGDRNDRNIDNKYISDDNEEEAQETEEAIETVEVIEDKSSTKKPYSLNLDLEKLRKSLTGAEVAQVIDRILMAQRKSKEGNGQQVVVMAPGVQSSIKKSKKSTTNPKSVSNSNKSSKSSKSMTTTTTSTTTTTPKPVITRTTLKPFDRSKIQSLSLKLSDSAITTTKPKRTQIKVNTIKIRRTTTTPPTTTTTTRTTTTTTTRKPNTTKKRSRSRKTSLKSSKMSASKTTTTSTTQSPTVTTMSSSHLEVLKSKIRQKELEFILSKVESLEKQQKHFLKQTKEQDLLAENSFRENVYKPNIEVIPFRQKHPEYSYGYSSRHNYDIQPQTNQNTQQTAGWQPSPPLHMPPPPPPPPPPMPNGPNRPSHLSDPNVFHNHNQQMFGTNPMSGQPHVPSAQAFPDTQAFAHMSGKPHSEPNMMPMMNPGLQSGRHLFNGVLPIPNNRAISLGSGDPHIAQESNPEMYRIKQRGHTIQKSEKPGIQLSFGGGPMGGGGQLKTSPMGIFKTLLLPLLPKPRMNLNGKVVFGVVLENGVGFGKKPKIVAQHFSTGHI